MFIKLGCKTSLILAIARYFLQTIHALVLGMCLSRVCHNLSRPGPETPRFTVIESLFPDGRGAGLAPRCHCHLAVTATTSPDTICYRNGSVRRSLHLSASDRHSPPSEHCFITPAIIWLFCHRRHHHIVLTMPLPVLESFWCAQKQCVSKGITSPSW